MNYEVPVYNGAIFGNRNSMVIEVRISFEKETRKVYHFWAGGIQLQFR